MPSIFTVLGRIIQGKPVFDPSDQQQQNIPPQSLDQSQIPDQDPDQLQVQVPGMDQPLQQPMNPEQAGQPEQQPEASIQKGNASTYPVAYVKRTLSHPNGEEVQIFCYITNAWTETLEMKAITIFGHTEKLEVDLHPGQEREVRVYEGPALKTNAYHQAQLDYKTETGDYFRAMHDIIYHFNPDNTYLVEDVRLHLPIYDIYG